MKKEINNQSLGIFVWPPYVVRLQGWTRFGVDIKVLLSSCQIKSKLENGPPLGQWLWFMRRGEKKF